MVMKDYSEITSELNKKILSMNHALNDKKWAAAKVIIQDILVDFDELFEIVTIKGAQNEPNV